MGMGYEAFISDVDWNLYGVMPLEETIEFLNQTFRQFYSSFFVSEVFLRWAQ